ncbi:MAG: hypothetical protein ACQERS_00785 [Bacteroidota bacterium]
MENRINYQIGDATEPKAEGDKIIVHICPGKDTDLRVAKGKRLKKSLIKPLSNVDYL